jgi:formamidopyrimidine-DNA glycosylase
MPELPEVETIKNELLPHVIGRRITGITLPWEGIVRRPSLEEFRFRLVGREITALSRRGKYLIFSLGNGKTLITHLKMTGSLLVKASPSEPEKFTRAIIHLDNGSEIHFRDPRKFGVMWLVDNENTVIGKLGPEPLSTDFTPQLLAQRLKKRTAPIKALLCDQTLIAGIGNMYADEALFAAGIHPLRKGGDLSPDELERLHRAIRQILGAAIGNKGASIENYFRPDGTEGTAQFEFKVAHRRGQTCPTCGTPLQRIPIRNRGSYFCPRCQRI